MYCLNTKKPVFCKSTFLFMVDITLFFGQFASEKSSLLLKNIKILKKGWSEVWKNKRTFSNYPPIYSDLHMRKNFTNISVYVKKNLKKQAYRDFISYQCCSIQGFVPPM